MLVGFGLGWTGEQVASMVTVIEAITAWIARRAVTGRCPIITRRRHPRRTRKLIHCGLSGP
jgi:hypothetical protein